MSLLNQQKPNEADIIFNRANIALARSQRLVASWLPAKTEEESLVNREGKNAEEEDDDKIFTAVPERLGLGAPIPVKQGFGADGSLASSNNIKLDDKLRQRLLGKNAKKFLQQQQQAKQQQIANKAGTGASSGSASRANADGHDEDDEEEEGRTSLGKSKRVNKKKQKSKGSADAEIIPDDNNDAEINTANGPDDDNDENDDIKSIPVIVPIPSSSGSKRKKAATGSYLDELLDRKKKKKKKRAANE